MLDDQGRRAAPKKKGKRKTGRLKSRERCTFPSEEAILVWDQLQGVGKRNLRGAYIFILANESLTKTPSFVRGNSTCTCVSVRCSATQECGIGPIMWTPVLLPRERFCLGVG